MGQKYRNMGQKLSNQYGSKYQNRVSPKLSNQCGYKCQIDMVQKCPNRLGHDVKYLL